MLRDVSEPSAIQPPLKIREPIAEAVFLRGQKPACASVNDVVENDLKGTLEHIRHNCHSEGKSPRYGMVLLDLCFYQGVVTDSDGSGGRTPSGMPEPSAEDNKVSELFGLKLLTAISKEFPDLPVVILSSQDRERVKHQFSKRAAAFISRANGTPEELSRYLKKYALMEDPSGLILGRSLPLLKALKAARNSVDGDHKCHVLLRGERGVGKELFAKYIHEQHPTRSKYEFIPVNAAKYDDNTFDSEIFGVKKGAFTEVGASAGAVSKADLGDLFLDEVYALKPSVHPKLMRFLAEGTYFRHGDSEEQLKANVRVISATNANIEEKAEAGEFPADLLDRLRFGGTIKLPPLRERREDIPLLARRFVQRAERGGDLQREFSKEAMEYLQDQAWNGNVRDLEQVLSKVVNLSDVEVIHPLHIEKAQQEIGLSNHERTSIAVGEMPYEKGELVNEDESDPSPRTLSLKPASQMPFDELLTTMRDYRFDKLDIDSLMNRLDALEEAAGRLIANYAQVALKISKGHERQKVSLTRGVKFMQGKEKLTTNEAARVIRKLLESNDNLLEWTLSQPILSEAHEIALGGSREARKVVEKRKAMKEKLGLT
ncbi:sigma-54 dependent transcriptional regulator [Bremerella sp. TYQ1]|uniref:sigma-54-dependent transcriptional regulator n=1 Tax=Bremerella sp. TYQ1 TaxID=3119568 RepID=UPI001CCF5EAD|nr:sigma 54-interacting transcriptional regulator [Bremerella volcania]UBM36634.1 sigma 54-interacting transcriptional regulator [Bremerella volcania]